MPWTRSRPHHACVMLFLVAQTWLVTADVVIKLWPASPQPTIDPDLENTTETACKCLWWNRTAVAVTAHFWHLLALSGGALPSPCFVGATHCS